MDYKYMQFISKFSKFYETVEEFNLRKELFIANDAVIEAQNAKQSGYTAGHNYISDWITEEKESMLGIVNDLEDEEAEIFSGVPNSTGIDWRNTKDVVTPVKNQGQCGSCWAFSTIEATESAYVIAGNEQVIMAPQELVDCNNGLGGNNGCNGGWYYTAYKWLKKNPTMRESDYPYVSGETKKGGKCHEDKSEGVTEVSSYKQVSKNTDSIKAAIEIGPVNVAVSAGNDIWYNYTSGIVTEADHCPTRVDHAVVAVGWGVEGDQEYYIVRNSWDTTWGDKGYIKIATADGKKGVCGINSAVYYPII